MSTGRHSVFGSLAVVFALVGLTIAFVAWALLVGPEVQQVIVRAVVVTLIIFLVILFLRYFSLLWFSYLGHAERNVLGVREIRELPPISILVPAYNEGRFMGRARTSLMKLDYPEYEVLVIDDGSSDDTLAIATEWEGQRGPGLFRVITKPNGGKASALNAGIAHSGQGVSTPGSSVNAPTGPQAGQCTIGTGLPQRRCREIGQSPARRPTFASNSAVT